MMKKLAVALLVLVCAAVPAAVAQPLEQDTMEVMLNGAVDFQTPGGKAGYNIDLALGYFVIDNWEVGPGFNVASDGKDNGWGLGGFTEYNFNLDMPLVPYVGGYLHYVTGDYYVESALQFTGALGLKFFLSESVALGGAFQYRYANKDIYNNDGSMQNTDYGLALDVRAFF